MGPKARYAGKGSGRKPPAESNTAGASRITAPANLNTPTVMRHGSIHGDDEEGEQVEESDNEIVEIDKPAGASENKKGKARAKKEEVRTFIV